jgi:hypothetical protein
VQRRDLLVRLLLADGAFDDIAPPQVVAADLALGDVDVTVARQVPGGPEEAVPLGEDVEDA